MNTIIVVIMTAALVSLCAGVATSLVRVRIRRDERLSKKYEPVAVDSSSLHWNFTNRTIVLGLVLIFAPSYWFGSTWQYFHLPHNGIGMGSCLVILSVLQAVALWRRASIRVLSTLFFFNGFVFQVSSFILFMEGLLSHDGLIASLFMFWVGIQGYSFSASMRTAARRE